MITTFNFIPTPYARISILVTPFVGCDYIVNTNNNKNHHNKQNIIDNWSKIQWESLPWKKKKINIQILFYIPKNAKDFTEVHNGISVFS